MNSEQIFAMGLGISAPWNIKDVYFGKEATLNNTLHITIDFTPGTKFPDKHGNLCDVHDTLTKKWRHLNFFQHECYLECRVPRIKTKEGVKLIEVPWARENSGFTLLFEGYVMALIENGMNVNKAATLVNTNPSRLWTIFNHWIERAYIKDKPKTPEKLGIDETSRRKGHDYITLAVDLQEKKVLHVTEGKDSKTVKNIKEYLESKNVKTSHIKHVSMDMSPSFISGVKEYLPNAEIHFDRFHVVKLLNKAMDEVRKAERKEHSELKGHKYTFLRNQEDLSDKKKKELAELITLFPTLGEAYRLKVLFNDLWDMATEEEATEFLLSWCKEVESKKIRPFEQFIKTIKAHWTGIVNFCETQINNGILEGINSKIQLIKRKARGYRRLENFVNMIYFLCGKLEFDYPHYST